MTPLSVRFFLSCCIVIVLVCPLSVQGASSVFLSEIQIVGEKADDEFIELANTSDTPLSLDNWSIRRKTKGDMTAKGSSLKTFGASDAIPANGFFLWTNSNALFKDFADATTGTGLTNDNSLGLFDADGNLVDSITWGTGHTLPFAPTSSANPGKNEVLLRDLSTLTWSLTSDRSPTNSQGEVWKNPDEEEEEIPEDLPTGPSTIRINEILPNPKEKGDVGEFIELYNFGEADIVLTDWRVKDGSTTGRYVFPSGKTLKTKEYLVLTDTDFTFALNNSNETVSLLDPKDNVVHSVSYTKTKEGVSLNLVGNTLRGSKKPTPGEENNLNTDPETRERVPQKGYRDIAVDFHARGTDTDGDNLKFTWDFGDGRKSYKEETSHTYKETGRYTVTLTTDDGTDTIEEVFEIKIEKYKPPKLRIVSWMPNPEGKDGDNEWIEIENREKKSVNLKDFSIATGSSSKKITNHPIRDDFTIGGGDTKRITRDESLFTLGNTKGRIELRAPNGEVIHKVKYKFEESLDEGIVLKKEKGSKSVTIEETEESSPSELPLEVPTPLEAETVTAPEGNTSAVLGAMTETPSENVVLEETPLPQEIQPTKKERWFPALFSWLENINGYLGNLLSKD